MAFQAGEGLTALRFDDGGLQCAVGTSNGLVALFDLRASRPSIVKDHMYGAPIRDIKFHTIDSIAGTALPSQNKCSTRTMNIWTNRRTAHPACMGLHQQDLQLMI